MIIPALLRLTPSGRLVNDPDPERARRAMEAMLAMGKIEVQELRRAADAA